MICDAGKGNAIHGLFGRFWMATGVQVIARRITGEKDHSVEGVGPLLHPQDQRILPQDVEAGPIQPGQGPLALALFDGLRFSGVRPANPE